MVLKDSALGRSSVSAKADTLMTLAGGHRCSATPELRESLSLPAAWWSGLHASLETLATTHTQPGQLRQADVTARLEVFFGDRVADPMLSRWAAAHTDLHWANLLAPECVLVDWEGWGMAPAGLDAASLYLHSLLQPGMAERVRAELGSLLEDQDGLISQLYVTGHLLLRINSGDYTDLAVPLHRNADRVIEVLRSHR